MPCGVQVGFRGLHEADVLHEERRHPPESARYKHAVLLSGRTHELESHVGQAVTFLMGLLFPLSFKRSLSKLGLANLIAEISKNLDAGLFVSATCVQSES